MCGRLAGAVRRRDGAPLDGVLPKRHQCATPAILFSDNHNGTRPMPWKLSAQILQSAWSCLMSNVAVAGRVSAPIPFDLIGFDLPTEAMTTRKPAETWRRRCTAVRRPHAVLARSDEPDDPEPTPPLPCALRPASVDEPAALPAVSKHLGDPRSTASPGRCRPCAAVRHAGAAPCNLPALLPRRRPISGIPKSRRAA